MTQVLLFSAFLLGLVLLLGATYALQRFAKVDKRGGKLGENGLTMQGFSYLLILLAVIYVLAVFYILIKGTPWEGHLMEWMNIVVRLMHITFGIAWIGASFYFVFLENALNRTDNVRDELAGNLWAVHGGGFYYLEKYKLAPKEIPRDLHWFKYEAYFTWLSGFSLLFVVYYFNAGSMLIDPKVLDVAPLTGVAIGVGSFVVAWLIYDVLCKSPLVKKGMWFALLGFLVIVGFAFFYCQVFSARAAYIHFGAMLGTLMVGNVFFTIIPAQKAMVKAATLGLPLDPTLGKNALTRSLHNNYFTLPVLFVMVSNHFPSTFGHSQPWLILAAISLGVAGVKHWLNLREKKQATTWILPASVLFLLAVAFVSAPPRAASAGAAACTPNVSIAQVNAIVQNRCVRCHSSNPTDEVFKSAPNGVKYDSPEDIIRLKDKIMQRVVVTKTMPQNNKTNMTQEERDLIRCWIEQGAQNK
ncbi:urate hydroxylase PuuD [Hymenobacter chitinivorans]|uniref:Putative membrane protein n=1 Tax=Hymenobacter chitinivorans DSM 11115 TaxID=1121954 RepID=A0A2M9BAC6_9BACT|nr:urate hydroxylase PuuD [Hymenobacter chitinivorans]PJJ54887.1 putative membrane protein [Hymenobacter chitinivorans DSM 11115]